MDFASDNTAAAHPAMLEAIAQANVGPAAAYGADPWTERLETRIAELFERPASVFCVGTGTAANALALAALTPPWGSILTHREAHIETDECGAPEFFTGGAKLVLIDGTDARITPAGLEEALTRNRRGVHSVVPKALSLTQASERGCVYSPDEIAALTRIARREGLGVHMDGARFANAVAHLGCTPAEVTWRAGVDVVCVGATKNGALAAEAIVVFDPMVAETLAARRKRSGHLVCKHRFLAAQLLAYFDADLWLTLAARANALAQRIGAAAGAWLTSPVQSNQVFIRPGEPVLAALRARGARFYGWGPAGSGEARLVVRYDQPEEEVERLCAALRLLKGDDPA